MSHFRCKDPRVSQVLVGLHRIGYLGLADAIRKAADAGLDDRDAVVESLLDALAAENYLPDRSDPLVRTALWREYFRHRGEDYSEFLSEVEVVVCGNPGDDRDAFVRTLHEVLAEIDLKPSITFAGPAREGRNPQLVIRDEIVVAGILGIDRFRTAVRRSVSGW